MKKVAKLVTVSFTTRMIVDESASENEIIELSKARFINKVNSEISEHIESIEDDEECPYDANFDTIN